MIVKKCLILELVAIAPRSGISVAVLQARNTREDLIGSDIPQDLIYIDEEAQVIRVKMPPEEAREVHEIFDRHGITY